VLKDIANYSVKTKQKTIIFLGDIFDVPGPSIDKQVLIWTHNAFKRLASSCEAVYILSGNHDIYQNRSILSVFDDIKNITVISEPMVTEIEGRPCHFIPYTRDVEQLRDWLKEAGTVDAEGAVLFGHFSVSGAYAGKTFYRLKDGVDINLVPTDKFQYVILGHVHSAQIIKNVIYVGSIIQANASEENEKKYMIELTDKLRPIPLGGPQFHTVEVSNGDYSRLLRMRDEHPDHYYTIVLQDSVSEEALPKYSNDHRIRVVRDYESMREERLEIKKTDTLENLLTKYMEEYETDLDKETLIKAVEGIWNASE
jgi:DNA repair exonuclease SbcCD nuclease subunit